MPEDPGTLVSLLSDGGTLVAVVVLCWIFSKFVSRTQDAQDRLIERFLVAIDGLKSETAGMRTEIAKLADAVDDFRGGGRRVEGG